MSIQLEIQPRGHDFRSNRVQGLRIELRTSWLCGQPVTDCVVGETSNAVDTQVTVLAFIGDPSNML